jgi:hypothetical protein
MIGTGSLLYDGSAFEEYMTQRRLLVPIAQAPAHARASSRLKSRVPSGHSASSTFASRSHTPAEETTATDNGNPANAAGSARRSTEVLHLPALVPSPQDHDGVEPRDDSHSELSGSSAGVRIRVHDPLKDDNQLESGRGDDDDTERDKPSTVANSSTPLPGTTTSQSGVDDDYTEDFDT